MNKLKVFLQITAIFTLSFILFQSISAQTRVERILINEAKRITKDNFEHSAKTPKGAKVFGVKKPSLKMLNAIDKGLTDLFAISKKYKYKKRQKYSDYTIFIAKADRTKGANKSYSPDIAVSAGQYAGSDYDQGGYIYAAGMVMAYNPCAFIIADHTKQFSRVSDVVRYEGEHLVLYHNNRQLFNETADHSQGGGHPILK